MSHLANPQTFSSSSPTHQSAGLLLSEERQPQMMRQASQTSQRSVTMPSPRLPISNVAPSAPSSAGPSSASGSKSGSFIATPKLLSRRSSIKDKTTTLLSRKSSGKAKQKEEEKGIDGWKSPLSESGSVEVIETPQLRLERDPETGRKMINQYLVLQEIGYGTHGRVRLGRDLSSELPHGDDNEVGLGLSGATYYAIKIVDRTPKKKRLTGFSRQKGLSVKNDGIKMVNESEIRKEIAIFKKVNHPNVVRMKEIIDDPDSSKLFMILEYCEGGEIIWKLDDGQPALTVSETRGIFRDTLLGLEYLHHQGIIHRDIKPSNLLFAADGTVKISDFGCSHYSEALRTAASQNGPEGDLYVDDVELAKTAGSPAFFAPEMCYSGLDNEIPPRGSLSPSGTPLAEVPEFTLRPPSVMDEPNASVSDPLVNSPGGKQTFPLKSTISNDSGSSRRPKSNRTESSSTIQRRERTPITNAIDVWALGVTLYCLLCGKTPFDAPNEYLLMQVIPAAEYDIPLYLGRDHMSTDTQNMCDEAKHALDLLSHLLEKHPGKRISLDNAKKHPFTLHGLSDPAAWLASTDPHAQSFVTVSNDEVAAVVIKSSSFRERFRKGIKTISHKLQIFSATGRNRSRSIGDGDSASASASVPSSELVGQTNTPQNHKEIRRSRETSPVASPIPSGSLSRRFSLLSRPQEAIPSPFRQNINSSAPTQMTAAAFAAVPQGITRPHSTTHGPSDHRQVPEDSYNHDGNTAVTSPGGKLLRSPRQMTSTTSLDKMKGANNLSPSSSLQRRQSSDIDVLGRQRSPSSASSTGLGLGKLVRLLSRNGSQRSRLKRRGKGANASEVDDASITNSTSPAALDRQISLDSSAVRRSIDTLDSESCSSSRGVVPSPDRAAGGSAWESRRLGPPPVRRGSSLSERFSGLVDEEEDVVSEDEYEPGPPLQVFSQNANHVATSWRRDGTLGLDGISMHPASIKPTLEPIPDASPAGMSSTKPVHPLQQSTAPESPTSGWEASQLSRARLQASQHELHRFDRARSPLGLSGTSNSPTRSVPARIPVDGLGEDDNADEVLAISIGRRDRKGSILSRKPPMGG